ncbi:MAG: hypothetical protein BGO16_10170 [Nitrobacter sp. 62-23]|nr:MAG: hypothetical protein BGO16_10170 [Nitrobacter sp. 62-23]
MVQLVVVPQQHLMPDRAPDGASCDMATAVSSALAIDLASRAARRAATVPKARPRRRAGFWIGAGVEFRASDARYGRISRHGSADPARRHVSDGGSMMLSFPMFNDEIAAPTLRTGAHMFGARAAYAAAR